MLLNVKGARLIVLEAVVPYLHVVVGEINIVMNNLNKEVP